MVARSTRPIVFLLSVLLAGTPLRAESVRGSAQVNGVATAIELITGIRQAEFRYRPAKGADEWETNRLVDPQDVLPLLADTRLAFVWPALDRWAGADLVTLRDAALEHARLAWQKGHAA